MKRSQRQNGLSMIELLISLAISSFLILGITQVYIDNKRNQVFQLAQSEIRAQLLALATGLKPALIPESVAAKTCAQWLTYPDDYSRKHFDALREILDEVEPDYRL